MRSNPRFFSSGVRTTAVCSTCGGSAEATVTEVARDGTLSWDCELSCGHCGTRTASHNDGLAPEPFRSAILTKGGFVLDVRSPGMNAKAWKVMRATFGLSLEEARETWTALQSGRVGTETEMHHLRMVLEDAGLDVRVRRAMDSL